MSKNQDALPATKDYFSKGWEIRLILFLSMILLGLAVSYVYLKPVTEPNKVLMQSDILQGVGMSKEIVDFRKAHKGEEPLWTSRLFGGMPAYQLNTLYEGNLFRQVDKILKLEFLVPAPIGLLFLLFLGMYVLLISFKNDVFTSAMGAMAFLLGSYFYMILEAGHNSKLNTVAYIPMLLAGISITYRGRLFLGGALTAFFLAISINANHIQMTYYGMFIVGAAVVSAIAMSYSTWPRWAFLSLLLVIPVQWALKLPSITWKTTAVIAILAPLAAEIAQQVKAGTFSGGFMAFLKGKGLSIPGNRFRTAMLASVVILAAAAIAVTPNTARLLTNQEYLPETMRGGVVLKKYLDESSGTGDGLTKEYAYQWSNGVTETFTLLNPYYVGEASSSDVGKDSETHEVLQKSVGPQAADVLSENWPTYMGTQPFTSAPIFVGCIVCFLAVLGLLVAPDKYRWYLLVVTILGIALSWGRNWQWFSDLFFDNMPLYNKFRAVSTMLAIAQITLPILAALGVTWYISNPKKRKPEEQLLYLGVAAGFVVILLIVLWVIAPGTNGFVSPLDERKITAILGQVGLKNPSPALIADLQDALVDDRSAMFSKGIFRGLIFTLLAAGVLFVTDRFIKPALQGNVGSLVTKSIVGMSLCGLVMIEMIPIDRRYLNEDDVVSKQDYYKSFNPTAADQAILADPDPNFRVLNLTKDPWNDATSSYHHKNIGGYHPAKFRRYNDLINEHFRGEIEKIYGAMSGGGPEVVNNITAALFSSPALRMMNCKYLIYNPGQPPLPNPARLGNAWVVSEAMIAASRGADETDADVAIESLGKVDLKKTMIVEKEFESGLQGFTPAYDSSATIVLTSFQANALSYDFNAPSGKEQLVVFSEIYYNSGKGWQAYIDGKPVEHFRCNYVLRGMRVPGSKHKIDFKFEPASFTTGYTIDLAMSSLLLVLIAGLVFLDFVSRSKKTDGDDDAAELA